MYRDDGEAARARADALQADLDDTRDELETSKATLAETERRLADAEAKLAAQAPAETAETREPPVPTDAEEQHGRGWAIWVAGAGLVLLVLFVLVSSREQASQDPPPNPACTLRTEPAGAQIVAICTSRTSEELNALMARQDAGAAFAFATSFEMPLGRTPLTKDRLEWIASDVTCHGYLVARLPGYEDARVSSPLAGMGCSDHVERLVYVAPAESVDLP